MRAPKEITITRVHPHAWLWEPLETEPSFLLKPMFGTKAVYIRGKLMFCFIAKEDPWCGILIATEHQHHDSLRAAFPALTPHPVLPKWLYLRESSDAFERTGAKLIQLVRQRDARIGVVPAAKKLKRTLKPS